MKLIRLVRDALDTVCSKIGSSRQRTQSVTSWKRLAMEPLEIRKLLAVSWDDPILTIEDSTGSEYVGRRNHRVDIFYAEH